METPTFTINLDLPYHERWNGIIHHYNNKVLITEYSQFVDQTLKEQFGVILYYPISFIMWVLSMISFYITQHNNEYLIEMNSISQKTKKYGLTFAKLYTINFGYDFLAYCTAIVCKINNKVYHLRNMDWEGDVLRKCTMNICFTKRGREIYRGTTWFGYVGLLTAMRMNDKDSYTISLNFRKVGTRYIENLYRLLAGYQPIAFVIRNNVEKYNDSYHIANSLGNISMIAPCYLVFSCRNAGYLIQRDRSAVNNYHHIKYDSNATDKNPVIVQTNHDMGVKTIDTKWADNDPLLLNTIDRKNKAIDLLQNIDNSYDDLEKLFQIMQTEPIFNRQTVYTTIMCTNTLTYVNRHYLLYE